MAPLALLATGSCGGASGGSPDRILVIGGAEGKVADLLAAQYGMDQAPVGADLTSAKIILIDGDHVTPRMIAGLNGLKAAARNGIPVVLVDANEDTKAATADQLGAFGYPGGDSQATVFAKTESDDPSEYAVLEVPSGTNTLRKNAPGESASGNASGTRKGGTPLPITVTPEMVKTLMDLARRPNGWRSTEKLGISPPAGVKTVASPLIVLDGSAESKALDKQSVSRFLVYSFEAFLSEKLDGKYDQRLIIEAKGTLNVGERTRDRQVTSTYREVGWIQTVADLQTSVAAQDSLHTPIDAFLETTQDFNGSGFDVDNAFFVGYRDSQKSYNIWQYRDRRHQDGPDDWTANEEYSPNHNESHSRYFQSHPFNGLENDPSGIIDQSRLRPFPMATERLLPIQSRVTQYWIPKAVRGRVAVNYSARRRLMVLGIQDRLFDYPLATVAQDATYEDTNRTFILDFSKIAPRSVLESGSRP